MWVMLRITICIKIRRVDLTLLSDLNMSLGSCLTDASVYFDGFSIEQAKTLDPLSHYNEFSVFPGLY